MPARPGRWAEDQKVNDDHEAARGQGGDYLPPGITKVMEGQKHEDKL